MACKAQRDIVLENTGGSVAALFHFYDFVARYLPGATNGAFPGRLRVAAYGTPTGSFASESSPADNAYVVIEPDVATTPGFRWSDGTNWQLAVFARNNAGAARIMASTAGLSMPGPGLWFCFSRDGGWDDAAYNFGSAVTSGVLHVNTAAQNNLGGSRLSLSCVERLNSVNIADGVALLMWGSKANNGVYDMSLCCGAARAYNPTKTKPIFLFRSTPDTRTTGYGWGTTGVCMVYNAADTAMVEARTYAQTDFDGPSGGALVQGSLDWSGRPLEFADTSVTPRCVVGWATGILRGDASVATPSENSAHTYQSVNGVLFPIGDVGRA